MNAPCPFRSTSFAICLSLVFAIGLTAILLTPRQTRVVATTVVTEVTSGIELAARVDTGAAVTSSHYETMEIDDESAAPFDNVGKKVRLLLENRRGDREWVETKIVDYSGIRNAVGREDRYFVKLKLRCRGVEKDVVVTLNERSHLSHHLLLGRDFLKGDFLVDVSRDAY